MDCCPPVSSAHGISQARVLEWGAIFFSRGSSQLRDWTQMLSIAAGFFTNWATREAQILCILDLKKKSFKRNPNLYGHYAVWIDAYTHLVWGPVDELQRFSEEGPGVGSVVLRIWSLKAEARYQLVWTYFSIWTMTILVCIPYC